MNDFEPVNDDDAPTLSPNLIFWMEFFSQTPRVWVARALVGVNVAVFAIMTVAGVNLISPNVGEFIQWGANYPPKTTTGEWWRLFTSTFLHIGFIHLLVNMWSLWNVGPFVERLVGNTGFFLLYCISGLGGSIAFAATHSYFLCVGASASIFGACGALMVFVVLQRDSIPKPIRASLQRDMIIFVVANMFLSWFVPGIGVWTNIGGLVTGLACGLILCQPVGSEAIQGRPLRNAATAIAGLALIATAMYALSGRGLPQLLVDEFLEMERRNTPPAQELTEIMQGRPIPPDWVDYLDRKLIPNWRAMSQQLHSFPENELYDDYRDLVPLLANYATLRKEEYESLAECLRSGEAGKREQATRKKDEADQLLPEIRRELAQLR